MMRPLPLHRYETGREMDLDIVGNILSRYCSQHPVTTTARSLKHFGLSVALHRKRRINSA